ncbi:hypothetical protein BT93_H2449 [Corymbia citriodora subsp. variegata]|nr:hypothetical protein BT93_H2449 [Corymbia citriodora subsp. variegata]
MSNRVNFKTARPNLIIHLWPSINPRSQRSLATLMRAWRKGLIALHAALTS